MQLKLTREVYTTNSTIGRLFIDGRFECWTLEDMVRPVKIKSETAIPAGTYKVIVNMSNRFKTRLPLLIDVPNFEGVRIHPGNTKADTDGCILVGQSKGVDSVGASRAAFAALLPKLEAAVAGEGVTLEIVDGGVPIAARSGPPPGAGLAGAKAAAKRRAPTKKKAAKKAAAKKAAPKKASPKKAAPKKAAVKKAAPKKPTARKAVAKKPAAKKPAARKPAAKKAATQKATAKKATAKKVTAAKAPARRAGAKTVKASRKTPSRRG